MTAHQIGGAIGLVVAFIPMVVAWRLLRKRP